MKTLRLTALGLAAALLLAGSAQAHSRHNNHRHGHYSRYSHNRHVVVQQPHRHQRVVYVQAPRYGSCQTVSVRPGFHINLALKF